MSIRAGRLLTQGEIEQQIMAISDALEEATDDYASASYEAALAEADYRREYARAMVHAADADGPRVPVSEREARALLAVTDQHRAYKVLDARAESGKQALYSLRARLDALRTLAANVRAQT